MKIRHVWIVFKKEVRDIIRDKKTVITSILVPMVLMPVFNILVGGGVENLQRGITENVTIALAESSNTPDIRTLVEERIIRSNPNIRLVDTDNPVEAVKKEEVRAVLEFEKDYAAKLAEGKTFEIRILYDQSKTKSEGAFSIVSEAIESLNRSIVEERLTALGMSAELLEPAKIVGSNVAEGGNSTGNMMILMVLPLMISLLISLCGIPAATDLVAGEKERNTFEPLLTTKPGRSSLLMGKYLTVAMFSIVSVAAIAAGMGIGYILNPNTLTMGTGELGGFTMDPLAGILLFIITIALGMTFTGLQIAISTYARSFKEAQTYMSFLTFAAMIPGYATMFMQPNDIQTFMFALPVLNTIAAFKMILGGLMNYVNLLLALGTSVLYVAGTLWLAARLFNKEKVLFRS